ncbi:murein L,D-transpeptidase family protein [Roseibium sp. RKSG952]|uniref:L,D-transpeptidase family protein n=1 Tax=Roseibium sp. RKSG952 TaxID=2529384 RepID=UPI0012BCE57B|nr:murein L,D-transpeptidase family protein [Roseibium sp. RKSG952]MTH98087.1 murein L,D-transpeptidase [Roseibium sp. RKSG952]
MPRLAGRRVRHAFGAALVAGFLAGCQADEFTDANKAQRPVSLAVKAKMARMDMSATSPIMIRIFKEENQLEVWKEARNGRFELLESFEICKWSGELGPKFKEGDRQAPEGFYEITPGLMNPYSSYHLAFNLGFPNRYDQAHGRTGSHLMVHGACSSRGCYAMTDEQVQDIYALARDSFKGGQRTFQVQAFPFRMTPENMAKHRDNEHLEFWRMLKVGYDHFELTNVPPKISVCEKRYVFDATPIVEGVPFRATAKCPDYEVPARLQQLVDQKQSKDNEKFQQIVARIEAREERQRRWEERQSQIAGFLGGGDDEEAPVATAVEEDSTALATADTVSGEAASGAVAAAPVRPGSATGVASAFAAPSQQDDDGVGAVIKRWLPFGGTREAEASVSFDPVEPAAVPEAKPQ